MSHIQAFIASFFLLLLLLNYRCEAAGEVRGEIVLELSRLEQLGLDDVVEAELSDRDEDGPDAGPVRAVEQLLEALLASHASKAVDRVLVAGIRKRKGSKC